MPVIGALRKLARGISGSGANQQLAPAIAAAQAGISFHMSGDNVFTNLVTTGSSATTTIIVGGCITTANIITGSISSSAWPSIMDTWPTEPWVNWDPPDYARTARELRDEYDREQLAGGVSAESIAAARAAFEEEQRLFEERQIAAALVAAEEQRRIEAEYARARQAADRAAHELLAAHLDQDQVEQYRKHKCFDVVLRAKFWLGTPKRFRIKHGWAGNVEELDKDGRAIARYCIHFAEQIPVPDLMLAQKLLLEEEPERFLKIANRTALQLPDGALRAADVAAAAVARAAEFRAI